MKKSSVGRAHDIIIDGINDALMNEGITLDDLTQAVKEGLEYYKALGKRLTPTKRRII